MFDVSITRMFVYKEVMSNGIIISSSHYLRLLQLYMRRRNENGLKQENQSYEDRYKEVEGDILWVCEM